MKLIVGLGNPGEKYGKSRHNLGFMVLDAFLRKLVPVEETIWRENKRFKSLIAGVDDLILAKPQTFMNLSGFVVKKLITNYSHFIEDSRLGRNQLLITDLWVVHDDLDLPLGRMKIRQGGAAGGHHGVESIIKQMGTDQFVRFRLGIGHPRQKPPGHLDGQAGLGWSDKRVEDYVLAPFGAREKSIVKKTIKRGIAAIKVALEEGLERAMSRFNQ